jgi:SAM-dependent methyltransferase
MGESICKDYARAIKELGMKVQAFFSVEDKRFMQVIRHHLQSALYRYGWDTRCRNLVPARILKAVLRDIPLRTEPMLLDIGCGQLGVAAFLPHVSVMGTDIDPPVASTPNFTFQLGSITALPFADRSFPLVSCIDVLEHLSLQDRERGINELVRVATDAILVAYPQGKLAADMDEEFRRDCELHGKASPSWLIEHQRQPYPVSSTIVEQLHTAVRATGRKAIISLTYCEPASVSRIVRRAAARSNFLYAAVNLFFGALLPLIRSPNDSNGYRAIALIELSADG